MKSSSGACNSTVVHHYLCLLIEIQQAEGKNESISFTVHYDSDAISPANPVTAILQQSGAKRNPNKGIMSSGTRRHKQDVL